MTTQLNIGNSLIVLIGTTRSVTLQDEHNPRFMLGNADGLFSVHLEPCSARELAPALKPGMRVCVVGQVSAYYQRRNRCYQFVIKAALVTLCQEKCSTTWPPPPYFLFKQIAEYVLGLGAAASGSRPFLLKTTE